MGLKRIIKSVGSESITMKIVQLDIQGFRSLKDVSWRPGNLNVVIGPNGSGKSNLLRMLQLISAAAQRRLSKNIQTEGGIGNILWDGQGDRIGFQVKMSQMPEIVTDPLEMVELFPNHPTKPPRFQYDVKLIAFGLGIGYRVLQEVLQDNENDLTYISRQGLIAQIYSKDGKTAVRPDAIDEEETILPVSFLPFGTREEKQYFAFHLQNWTVYTVFHTDQNAPMRQAPLSRFEEHVAPDGQNLINVLHTLYTSDRKFKQDINDAMHAAFGDDFDELIFPPAADQRIQMRVRWRTLKREQSTADLSDGTLRFLFLITVLASPNPPPLIAIDEPETGLHPSMLPIIAEYAVEAATRTQVIFTTHSDQFLDAFRETRPTTTVAKWENGETTLTTLEDRELAYWLKDYSLGNLFRSGELENMAA